MVRRWLVVNIDELADHFDNVKMTARGFTARCPAHDDRTPSLAVDEGHTWFLVSCGTGCSFDAIVQAAGLMRRDFAVNSTNSSGLSHSNLKARLKMREMRDRHGVILTTLHQIVEVALQPDAEWLLDVADRWQLMSLPFDEAMKMGHVVVDGPIFDLIHMSPTNRWVKDWSIEKREIHKKLWQTYRERGPR